MYISHIILITSICGQKGSVKLKLKRGGNKPPTILLIKSFLTQVMNFDHEDLNASVKPWVAAVLLLQEWVQVQS